MTEEQARKVRLVSLGARVVNEVEGRAFYQLQDDGTLPENPEARVWGKAVVKYMRGMAGSVYEVESPKDGTIVPASARFIKLWEDQEKRAEWQVLSEAARDELEYLKAEARARKDEAVFDCLEPIRRAYREAVGVQKRIVLVRAIMAITSPRKG